MEALIAVAVIVLLLFIIIAKGVIVVRQAEVVIIERLGTYSRSLQSGLHIIVPILDQTRAITWRNVKTDFKGATYISEKTEHRIDLREAVYDFPRQNVITSDNVTININALLYFQITDPYKATYEIKNLPQAIEKLTQTTLRNVIGELELDKTLTSRDTINTKLRLILDEATDKWGVKVNRVELQDIEPPQEIKAAMEMEMRAERNRRAKVLQADGERESSIRVAEGNKKSKVLEAEGKAEARLLVAEAEKKSIDLIAQAMKQTSMDPAQYQIALKYIEAFQTIVKQGDKTVVIPYEATAMLGSVKTMKEIFGANQ
jgi:regulator of protease activity HflC (stomatin/prohibitin superfamily)